MEFRKTDLNPFFYPESIAIVGVSDVSKGNHALGGVGYLIKLQESEFPGKLYPLNPKADEILGVKVYPDLSSLPEVPDMAIIAVAAKRVPGLLEECARIGLRHIHILSAGFKEIGTGEGRALEEQVRSISREKGLLVMGPNCMGSYCPTSHVTPWGAIPGRSGPLGVISQSGLITQRLTEHICSLGIGVEKAVSIGNATVLSIPDYLEHMAEDDRIGVIALYIESIGNGRELLDLVKEVNGKKPVIIWKGGETAVGASTVVSHTGAMAGEQKIWKAFFRQAGAVRVLSMNEWVDTIMAFCLLTEPAGKGIFIIGGGGGNSVTHSDISILEGLDVPKLSDDTMERLRQLVPLAGSIAGNPLDASVIVQNAAHLTEVLDLAYKDPALGMVVVDRLIPTKAYHLPDMPDCTLEVIDFISRHPLRKPTIFTVDSEGGDRDLAEKGIPLRGQYCTAGIPAYPSMDRAVKAMVHLCEYFANRPL